MSSTPQNSFRAWLDSRFGFTGFHFAALLVCFSVLRLVLLFGFGPPAPIGESLEVFPAGLHIDITVALFMTLPLVFWFALLPHRLFRFLPHRLLFLLVYFVAWAVEVFLLIGEYYFFEEFKSRYNTVAIDYLLYPHEVFINIWDTYPVPLIIAVCSLVAAGIVFVSQKVTRRMWETPVSATGRALHLGGALTLAAGLWLSVRVSETRFSKERVINEIADNGMASLITAAWSRNLDYAAFYPTLPRAEAFGRARRLLAEPGADFEGPPDSLRRRIAGSPANPRLNVVILLEESLGSEFWGSLGRKGTTLTPELDKLSEEGLFFTNLYADGNRTVRGFEGVLSSFPPLPGDSIVKRDRSENVETIARVLKRDGYETVFLYGGRGIFDGMRSYAVNNGYDRFIEQKDFPNPTFATIWGVCNEDLYRRTIEECRALSKSGKPFLATVLSVSNHKPFTYPAGRIPEDPNARKREHAVKYTDWALGGFLKTARNESFYQSTIFVVIADHGARVYGSQSIPIHSYEIPFLVLGPAAAKKPARLPQLGCQLDVAPTILGLIGRPYDTLFFGHDLLMNPPPQGRVLINHNRDIGLMRDDRMVVLSLNKKAEFYGGNPKITEMARADKPDDSDLELEKDATAMYQAADELYMQRKYRVQESVQAR